MPVIREAAGLVTLKKQFDKQFPGRDTRSDGWIGDRAHQARTSQHNPNSRGYVCARDFDEDVKPRSKKESERLMRQFADELIEYAASGLPGSDRVMYVVYEDRLSSGTYKSTWWKWRGRGYGHTIHLHLSVTQAAEKDGQPWPLPIFGYPPFATQKRQLAAKKAAAKRAKKTPARKTAAR